MTMGMKPDEFAKGLVAPELVQDTAQPHSNSCSAAMEKNSESREHINLDTSPNRR